MFLHSWNDCLGFQPSSPWPQNPGVKWNNFTLQAMTLVGWQCLGPINREMRAPRYLLLWEWLSNHCLAFMKAEREFIVSLPQWWDYSSLCLNNPIWVRGASVCRCCGRRRGWSGSCNSASLSSLRLCMAAGDLNCQLKAFIHWTQK